MYHTLDVDCAVSHLDVSHHADKDSLETLHDYVSKWVCSERDKRGADRLPYVKGLGRYSLPRYRVYLSIFLPWLRKKRLLLFSLRASSD